jgi:hypothetical protein
MPPLRDRLALWLLRLYPRTWRDRYGEEFLALLDSRGITGSQVIDVVASASSERSVALVAWLSGTTTGWSRVALRQLVRALGTRVGISLIAASGFLLVDGLFDGASDPLFLASTWTPTFIAALVTALLSTSCAAYVLGRAVLAVRRRHSPDAESHASMMMCGAIMVVLFIVASHPPAIAIAAPFRLVNQVFGPRDMFWMMPVQFSLPEALAPWYRSSGWPQVQR